MTIAVYGSGSLGTIIGAYLSATEHSVDLVDTYDAHIDTLNRVGATVEGTTDFHINVHALKPEAITKTYDLILLLTKQTYNATVLPMIKNILKTDGVLLSLQNGVPEELIQQYIPKKNIIAGSVEFGATFKSPGVSALTTDFTAFKNYALQIGELDGEITLRLKTLKTILDSIGNTHLSDNLLGTKWSKLLINSTFSGLSATLNCTYGDVLKHPLAFKIAMTILDEGIKVGHANHIKFAHMANYPIDDFENHNKPEKLNSFMQPSKNLEASMLQDLRKQRQTEINDINGLIVEIGEKVKIPTPFNQKIVDIVTTASQTNQLPEFEKTLKSLLQNV
ncbi:2-dehydropantoate 2-reductase [Staphylococcus succinus]|nr:2-dehydropantoate 2-reductase [Staphylococcus succinus]